MMEGTTISLNDQLQHELLQFLRNNLRFTECCFVDLEATIRCDKSSETLLHIHEILRPDEADEENAAAEATTRSLLNHTPSPPCSPTVPCCNKTNKRKARAPIKWAVTDTDLSSGGDVPPPAKLSPSCIKPPPSADNTMPPRPFYYPLASPQSAAHVIGASSATLQSFNAEVPLDLSSCKAKVDELNSLTLKPPTKPQLPNPHEFPLSHLLRMPMQLSSLPPHLAALGFPFFNNLCQPQSSSQPPPPKLAPRTNGSSSLHGTIPRRNSTGCKSFSCNQCREKFTSLALLSKHTFEYHKGYKCTYCHASFTQRSNLQRHSLKHVGFKPFSCRVCTKAYYRKDHLVRHIEVTHPGYEAKSHIDQRLSSSESLDFLERHGSIINNLPPITSTTSTSSNDNSSFFRADVKHKEYDVKSSMQQQQLGRTDSFQFIKQYDSMVSMMTSTPMTISLNDRVQLQAPIKSNSQQQQAELNDSRSSELNLSMPSITTIDVPINNKTVNNNNNNIFLPQEVKLEL